MIYDDVNKLIVKFQELHPEHSAGSVKNINYPLKVTCNFGIIYEHGEFSDCYKTKPCWKFW